MDYKDTFIKDASLEKLVTNTAYYSNIFKKTEKIVSVVFYIIQNSDIDKRLETHSSNVISKAHFAHENALRTLEVKPANGREVLEQFAQSMIGLESTLRVAAAAGLISAQVLNVVTDEILTVLRSLQKFISDIGGATISVPSFDAPAAPTSHKSRSTSATRTIIGASAVTATQSKPPAPNTADRRTRIKTIIEAKGEASIKDISEIISDVSEKTIQRELNSMIEDNIVARHGERRWSKYSIA